MHGPSEVAGQNYYAVRGLREIGMNAESVVFKPHPFGFPYDHSLLVDNNRKALFPLNVLKLGAFFLKALNRYDVFHFHYGHSICEGFDLPFYNRLGKKFYFEFHGTDIRDVRLHPGFCINGCERYNTPPTLSTEKVKRLCSNATGIVLHDDELIPHLPIDRPDLFVVPLRVDISQFVPMFPGDNRESVVTVAHAPSVRSHKGTSHVIDAIERLKQEGIEVDLVLVEGKTQSEAFSVYAKADIVIDQLFIGTYGVFAVECMALGKPVITYIADDMKPLLPEDLPIVSATPDSLVDVLRGVVESAGLRRCLGIKGRQYAEYYHDYRNIAFMLRDIYDGSLRPITGREAFAYVKSIAQQNRLR